MSKWSDKKELEAKIKKESQHVPASCRPVFETMMRQGVSGVFLPFGKIKNGNSGSHSTGIEITNLCRMGLAVESIIETEYGPKRAWRLTMYNEVNPIPRSQQD